ncbi:MAG TPA: protein translocase subunit SecF [Streptosporangiaceae bacterium]|nr:protein translocase subunit SecF [Streptosporangiaceae bacterium]
MSRLSQIPGRLYRGEVSVDFVGRRRLWYTISGAILLICIIALATRGLNYSIDFKGGSVLQFQAPGATLSQIRGAVTSSPAGSQAIVQEVGNGGHWRVQASHLTTAQLDAVETAINHAVHVTNGLNGFSPTFVGPSWGSEISSKALKALVAFLIVIVIYLSIAFEWKMASAAFVALMHDIVITIGVYALAGFTVSPASVIGLLTILGYSLYDTVVVFDKVRENTAGLLGSRKSTYSQAANLALNQTLVRSINTSLIALLPVAAILFIGSALLGPGELQDLALVLFVGMLSGTYSSIFIATPVLAQLKERERPYQALAKAVATRESGGRAAKRQAARAEAAAGQAGTARGPVAAPAAAPPEPAVVDAPEAVEEPDHEPAPAEPGTPGEAAPERVPVGPGAPRSSSARDGVRPGQRQQPRRSSAARRRPGGKKKKR